MIEPQSSDFSQTVRHSPFSLQALPEGILKSMPQKNSGEKFLGFSKSAEAGSGGYVTTEKWRNQISGVFQVNKNLFTKSSSSFQKRFPKQAMLQPSITPTTLLIFLRKFCKTQYVELKL